MAQHSSSPSHLPTPSSSSLFPAPIHDGSPRQEPSAGPQTAADAVRRPVTSHAQFFAGDSEEEDEGNEDFHKTQVTTGKRLGRSEEDEDADTVGGTPPTPHDPQSTQATPSLPQVVMPDSSHLATPTLTTATLSDVNRLSQAQRLPPSNSGNPPNVLLPDPNLAVRINQLRIQHQQQAVALQARQNAELAQLHERHRAERSELQRRVWADQAELVQAHAMALARAAAASGAGHQVPNDAVTADVPPRRAVSQLQISGQARETETQRFPHPVVEGSQATGMYRQDGPSRPPAEEQQQQRHPFRRTASTAGLYNPVARRPDDSAGKPTAPGNKTVPARQAQHDQQPAHQPQQPQQQQQQPQRPAADPSARRDQTGTQQQQENERQYQDSYSRVIRSMSTPSIPRKISIGFEVVDSTRGVAGKPQPSISEEPGGRPGVFAGGNGRNRLGSKSAVGLSGFASFAPSLPSLSRRMEPSVSATPVLATGVLTSPTDSLHGASASASANELHHSQQRPAQPQPNLRPETHYTPHQQAQDLAQPIPPTYPPPQQHAPPELASSARSFADDSAALAAPRRQSVRSDDDLYTPEWVRYDGFMKEGFCGLCDPPGRWLQLKNSAFWYHKQFVHGISAVSGRPFVRPLSLRVVYIATPVNPASGSAHPITPTTPTVPGPASMSSLDPSGANMHPQFTVTIAAEGLCHQCGDWHPASSKKRKGGANLLLPGFHYTPPPPSTSVAPPTATTSAPLLRQNSLVLPSGQPINPFPPSLPLLSITAGETTTTPTPTPTPTQTAASARRFSASSEIQPSASLTGASTPQTAHPPGTVKVLVLSAADVAAAYASTIRSSACGAVGLMATVPAEARDAVTAQDATVLWFRHAYKCHVYAKPAWDVAGTAGIAPAAE